MRHSLWLCLLPALALAQAPVIQISGANFKPLPVAVPPPLADAGSRQAARELDEALLFDLAASGLFKVLDRKSFLADAREGLDAEGINFRRWADVGADMLVKTQVSKAGDTVAGELRLYAVAAGREELKVAQQGAARNPRALAHHFAGEVYRHLTGERGPFGARLTFVKRNGADREVWLADWDGRNAEPVAQSGINILPTVTPGNDAVAFTSYRQGRPELFVGAPGRISVLATRGGMPMGITYSPDGTRAAWAISSGEAAQIWIGNADGTGARALTDSASLNTSPSFSPDGKRLAFVSSRGGSPQIYVMNVDGSGTTRLTFQGSYNTTPEWSPRGDVVAFTARDERNAFDLFTVNVETRQVARLTQDQGNNEEPSFSANGRLIVFSSTRGGGSQLYVMTADGSNQLPLPTGKGHFATPDWGR